MSLAHIKRTMCIVCTYVDMRLNIKSFTRSGVGAQAIAMCVLCFCGIKIYFYKLVSSLRSIQFHRDKLFYSIYFEIAFLTWGDIWISGHGATFISFICTKVHITCIIQIWQRVRNSTNTFLLRSNIRVLLQST